MTTLNPNRTVSRNFYDAQNRLNYAQVGSNIDQVAYDSKNRVVKRTVDGTVIYFVYDGWDLIEERNSSGTVLASYIHGVKQDELLSKTNTSGTVYYHHNALESVTDLTNASGTVIEKYKYDAFGKPSFFDGSGNPLTASAYGNRFLFTGREYLAKVNLYDYRNRVYSADLGRFLQTDPMSFSAGDVNIYRYCGNNPLNGTDAMGLCPNYTISLGFRSDGGGGGGAYDSNGNPIPNPGPEHAPTSLDPSGPTLPDGNEPGIAPPGYSGSYTGTAALDTDGGTPAAGEGSNHQSGTSLPGENADSDDYSVRNANSDGTYNYPLDTPTYTVNNQTGVGVEGVVGDSGPSSNNTNGINEGSTAQENALGTTQHNSNGVLLNSTNGASTTTYFYP